jgi:hypothetical protein
MARPGVRSEVFLRQDIQSILQSIDAANREMAARLAEEDVACYRAGFADALRAVATAFHASLDPAPPFEVEPERALPARRPLRIVDHVTLTSSERRTSG